MNIKFSPQELSAYRHRVIETVKCPYCHVLAGFLCRDNQGASEASKVDYVHDDRSLAFMISREMSAAKAVPVEKKLQFHIVHMIDTESWIPIPPDQGWKLKNYNGVHTLIIGTGIPRVTIPLINVKFFEIQEY